ncbi:MAG: Fic family protein [Candidatus Margulisiibacteriota bacterium]
MYKPIYKITPYLLNLVDEAGQLRNWVENASLQVAWLPILQREARTKTTHSSTAIEGNPLSLRQVEAVARGEKIGTPQAYEQEITNYLKAVSWLEKNASSTISEEALLSLHKLLTENILTESRSGKYKEKQNFVLNEKGIKIYIPPSPKMTPTLTRELIEWINSDEIKSLHPIIVCAISHHRLVSIHPFTDGNGRIARSLETWILYQRGFDNNHIFSLDDFFAKDRKRYYDKIEQARELDDNLTYWIEYVAEGIVKTLKDVKSRIESLQVSTKSKILLSPRQEELIRILRDFPVINVAIIQQELKVTRARVNQIISPLIASGLVAKEGNAKATRYRLNH